MSPIFPGRYTAQLDGSFVVFLIGMRMNKLWAVHKWLPVAKAMGPMVEHLLEHRDLGLLHAERYLYWPGAALVQYWRSFEQFMPKMGLALAGSHVPALGAKETAKRRLGMQGEPAVQSYETPPASH